MLRDPIVRDAVALGLAVGTFAVSFGALARAGGLSAAQTVVISLLVFTGASQFAFIGVLAAGGGLAAAVLPAAVLAVRNGLYGIALAPLLRGPIGQRLALSHLVIDESTAMARAQAEPHSGRRAFIATGLAILVCWNVGTALGVALGGALGDPRRLGLDAMLPAAFLALLAPQLRAGRRPSRGSRRWVDRAGARAVRPGRPPDRRRRRRRAARRGPTAARRGGMTWLAIGVLAAISFALKAVGPVIVGDRPLDPRAATVVAMLPVPMLTALIVVGTFADGQSLHVDERLPAVAVAAVCVLRRAAVPRGHLRGGGDRGRAARPLVSRAPRGDGRTRCAPSR